jgi:hypothetical protein
VAFATVEQLTEHVGLSENGGGLSAMRDDVNAKMERALDAATRQIVNDCGRDFAPRASLAKTLVSDGGDILHVPDLVSVSTLVVDDNADGTFETTLTAAKYELNTWHELDERWPFEYIVRLDANWPTPSARGRRRLVKITGTWGWSAIPDEIEQACLIAAARLLGRGNSPLGIQGTADFGPVFLRNSDPDYARLIAPFRKVGIA